MKKALVYCMKMKTPVTYDRSYESKFQDWSRRYNKYAKKLSKKLYKVLNEGIFTHFHLLFSLTEPQGTSEENFPLFPCENPVGLEEQKQKTQYRRVKVFKKWILLLCLSFFIFFLSKFWLEDMLGRFISCNRQGTVSHQFLMTMDS